MPGLQWNKAVIESSVLNDGRRLRGEQSRQRIISETLKLFAQHGYAGTSLSAICEATGLPTSSLHHHFGSKVGICLAAIENLGETVIGVGLRKRLRQVSGTAERVNLLVRQLLRHQEREYAALVLVIRLAMDADDIDPSIRPAVQRIRQLAMEDLVTSLEIVFEEQRPPVNQQQLETVARRLMVMLDGSLISHLTDRPGKTRAWSAEELKGMISASVTEMGGYPLKSG